MRIIDIAEYEDIRQAFLDATQTQVEITFKVELMYPVGFTTTGFTSLVWEEGIYYGIYSPKQQIGVQSSPIKDGSGNVVGFDYNKEYNYSSLTIPTDIYLNGIAVKNPAAPSVATGATATINNSTISPNVGNPTITGFIVRKLYGKKMSKALLFNIEIDSAVVGVDGTSYSAESFTYLDPIYGSSNIGQA
jgi:hypothetical protein